MAIEKLYLEHKQTGGRLTADEFNKLPEKVNELIDVQNTEEERVKKTIAKNRPRSTNSHLRRVYSYGMVISGSQ